MCSIYTISVYSLMFCYHWW